MLRMYLYICMYGLLKYAAVNTCVLVSRSGQANAATHSAGGNCDFHYNYTYINKVRIIYSIISLLGYDCLHYV